MLGQRLAEFHGLTGHQVHDATGHVARIEYLIHIAQDQRILLRGNSNHRIAHRNCRQNQRQQSEQRSLARRKDSDCAHGLRHRNRNVASGRMMHHAVVFVSPRGIGKDALNRQIGFDGGLFLANRGT